MQVIINGDEHEVAAPCTVEELLARLGLPCEGVAIALEGFVLPRSRWGEQVRDGWALEVLTAVQGG